VVVVGKLDDSAGSMKGIALIADCGEVPPKQSSRKVSVELCVHETDWTYLSFSAVGAGDQIPYRFQDARTKRRCAPAHI